MGIPRFLPEYPGTRVGQTKVCTEFVPGEDKKTSRMERLPIWPNRRIAIVASNAMKQELHAAERCARRDPLNRQIACQQADTSVQQYKSPTHACVAECDRKNGALRQGVAS
eukprot:1236496-Rhodomonas_salina.1